MTELGAGSARSPEAAVRATERTERPGPAAPFARGRVRANPAHSADERTWKRSIVTPSLSATEPFAKRC